MNKLQALIIKNIQFRVQWKYNCKSMLAPGTVPTVIVLKSMGKIQQLRTCPNTLRLQQGKRSVAQTNGWKRIHFPMFIFWINEISGRIKSRLGIYKSQRPFGLRNCWLGQVLTRVTSTSQMVLDQFGVVDSSPLKFWGVWQRSKFRQLLAALSDFFILS